MIKFIAMTVWSDFIAYFKRFFTTDTLKATMILFISVFNSEVVAFSELKRFH